MEFLKLASDRFSARKYKNKPVSKDDIEKILRAGQFAPTAHNIQPQKIIVVNSEEGRALLDKCTVCHYHAPLSFIICYDKNEAWKRDYDNKCSGDVDASIVTTHMMLEAKELGIDSTWIMYFIPEAVSQEFELPDNIVPVAILYMGYADEEPSENHFSRRDLKEYVTCR